MNLAFSGGEDVFDLLFHGFLIVEDGFCALLFDKLAP
jgi:hypothetical protein